MSHQLPVKSHKRVPKGEIRVKNLPTDEALELEHVNYDTHQQGETKLHRNRVQATEYHRGSFFTGKHKWHISHRGKGKQFKSEGSSNGHHQKHNRKDLSFEKHTIQN